MKLNRIIAFLAVIATTLSTAVAGTSANTSAVGNDKVEVYDKITIDQNTDLSALGLEGVVAFSAPYDKDNTNKNDTDSKNAAGISASVDTEVNYPKVAPTTNISVGIGSKAINENVPEPDTKDTRTTINGANATVNTTATLGSTAANTITVYECTDTDDEFDITGNRTWTINGSVQFNSTVVIQAGYTLTIKFGTPAASTSYSDPVVRLINGCDDSDRKSGTNHDTSANSKALFNLEQGAGLIIYGKGGSSTTYDYGLSTSTNFDRIVIAGNNEPDTPMIWCAGSSSTATTTLKFIGVEFRKAINEYTGTDYPSGGQGGAISINCDVSTAEFRSCLFKDCKARDGGAVAFRVFEQTNTATVFDKCVFTNCTATRNGGAVFTMHTGNDSIAPKFYGLKITNCLFNSCSAVNGGGFFTSYTTEDGSTSGAHYTNGITISNTKFKNCTATNRAGAIYFRPFECNNFTISDGTFEGCTAGIDGGAIILAGYTATIFKKISVDAKFSDCTAGEYGGAISINSGNYSTGIYLDGSSFSSCSSDVGTAYDNSEGGAVFVRPVTCGTFSAVGCVFNDCSTKKYGGGVSFNPGSETSYKLIDFTNSEFIGCNAKDDGGGLAFRDDPSLRTISTQSLVLSGSVFSGCVLDKAGYRGGAAIYISGKYKSISYVGGTIEDCKGGEGVGIMIDGNANSAIPSFVIEGVVFQRNRLADGRYGGVIKTEGKTAIIMEIKNCRFLNNINENIPDDKYITPCAGILWNAGATSTVSGFEVSACKLSVSDCYFEGNEVLNDDGAAIYNESTLVIERCQFINNKALNGKGGAIAMQNYSNAVGTLPPNVSLELDSETYFRDNQAKNGGAISFYCRKSNNTTNPYGYAIPFKLILDGTQIYDNTATENGGGIYFNTASDAVEYFDFGIELKNGDIYNNTAKNGAGIFATSEKTALNVKIVSGVIGGERLNSQGATVKTPNTASVNGGGIYLSTNLVSLVMTGGEISHNTAARNGGGVYITTSSNAVFTGGAISNNVCEDRGGGIFVDQRSVVEMSPATSADGTVIGYATVDNNTAKGSGGGIFIAGSSEITINEGIVSYNEALKNSNSSGNGGGIAMSSGTIVVNGGNFYGNEALKGSGGGIMATGASSSVSVYGGTIGSVDDISLANSASKGGGIHVQNGANLTVSDGCIGYNKALYLYDDNGVLDSATGVGGGIAVFGCDATITGGTVIGNQAENKGGGIYVYSDDQAKAVTFSGGTIGVDADGNPAANIANYGGGVYVNNASFNMTKDEDVSGAITNNVAIVDGGGLYVASAPITIAGDISDNIAARNGGGVYLENAAISFTGNIHGNKAGYALTAEGHTPVEGQGNGGGIYVASDYTDDTTVKEADINGTISGNSANLNGGGIYAKGGTVVTVNGGDIHSNNASNGNGGGIYATEANTFVEVLGGNIGLEDKPNIAVNGGGVYIDGADFILDKTANTEGSISHNLALTDGGGGYFYNTDVEINGNIDDNTAQGSGGGIYLNEAIVTVEGDISNNRSVAMQELRATIGNGGGACLVNSSVLNMGADGNITGNITDGNGGGIAAYSDSTVNLGGGVITQNTADYGFGGGVYANDSVVNITGSDINANSAKNGGGVCVTRGGNLVMLGGMLRYNTAIGTPEDTVTTAYHLDETLAGVGGGVYLSNGVEAELSTYELTGTDNKFGIYGNLAEFAADDVFANGVNTQLTLPKALSMTLKDTEFERAMGWFEDYAKDDTMYESGLNGNSVIGGERYKTAKRTVIAYVNETDAADKATEKTVYINTANTYVCLTLGVAKAGYGEITIMKNGENIADDQLFVFTVSGMATETNQHIEFSVTIKGAGSVTIVDVPDGAYTITEITDWSWRYELANIVVSNGSVDITNCSGTVTVGAADASPDVAFFNRLVKEEWLDGNSSAVKNVAGVPAQSGVVRVANYPITVDLPKKEELA
ncbi:MAG: hypothetical protein E7597_03525 [Ruminococcaceae bacterium]|nr:hypothetical protein [Oscillospiraceae bacterium]